MPRASILRYVRAGLGVAVLALAAWACGSLKTPSEPPPPTPEPPTAANPAPNPNPTPTPVLSGPPRPTPSPDPSASPDPGASPAPPQGAGDCRDPVPGPLAQINVKIHQRGDARWTIDSTPLVGPDPAYCAKIGFTDGRGFCPVRVEGNPEREACELYVTGRARDTGRSGPTWYVDGSLCTGKPGCENHEDNQYQVYAYKAGLYKACGKNDVCGDVLVDR
jgi:hypothetical protein